MAVTISLYNHTAAKFADGSFAVGDTYKLKLFTAATFNATHTTEAAAGGTEVANGNGYTTGGLALSSVTVSTVTTNDAAFDAADAVWDASGGSIAAACGRIYNDTDANDPPVAFIDFGETKTAANGDQFKVIWDPSGIVQFTVA